MAKVGSAAQTGILMPGPGGVRLNNLLEELDPLTSEQLESLNRAKKYALELSMKMMLQKQTSFSNQQQQQKTVQRHQALVLMCRVYVGSISFEVREETIKGFFSPFGAIKSINMSWDAVSLKHKGFAFVEYEIPEAAQMALEHMNGVQVGGRQIKVGRPSNIPQAAPIIQQIQEECKSNNRIYISNIHPDLSEQELLVLLEPFGKIRSCKLAMTPDVEQPQHRGYGFIEFETESAATEALTMDNFDLGGQVLHVCQATTPSEFFSIYGTLNCDNSQSSNISQPSNDNDIQMQLERTDREQQENEMDIRVSNGNTLNEENQHETKIANDDDLSEIPGSSNILILRNMVTSDEELDDSLQLDVYQECAKHGPITQVVIYLDKGAVSDQNDSDTRDDQQSSSSKDEVKIFVKYKDISSSSRAKQALDGRFFAGRTVSAEFYNRESFRLSDYSK